MQSVEKSLRKPKHWNLQESIPGSAISWARSIRADEVRPARRAEAQGWGDGDQVAG